MTDKGTIGSSLFKSEAGIQRKTVFSVIASIAVFAIVIIAIRVYSGRLTGDDSKSSYAITEVNTNDNTRFMAVGGTQPTDSYVINHSGEPDKRTITIQLGGGSSCPPVPEKVTSKKLGSRWQELTVHLKTYGNKPCTDDLSWHQYTISIPEGVKGLMPLDTTTAVHVVNGNNRYDLSQYKTQRDKTD